MALRMGMMIINFEDVALQRPFLMKPFKNISALAGVAQWIECWPANQRVAGSICIYGTCLGCRPGPQLGAYKRQAHIDISLLLFLLPFPSPKINK